MTVAGGHGCVRDCNRNSAWIIYETIGLAMHQKYLHLDWQSCVDVREHTQLLHVDGSFKKRDL